MAAAPAREPSTPPLPPVIGQAGRYTIFITPPATPRLPREKPLSQSPLTRSPRSSSVNASFLPQKLASPAAPPVQVPPPHFKMPAAKGAGLFGFLWDAVAKVQNGIFLLIASFVLNSVFLCFENLWVDVVAAHSSLDEYLPEWLGLDQSRYQWAVDDYFENTGLVNEFFLMIIY
ncbi:hypothetical protein KSP40_PGU000505 [Platanthera guangdongensis]|uniref:Uncharacterized protein n=1 Tax=Platanthera guangdongensis TaxID=2320717 RepID=A0ABR2MTT7_9ASPA